MDGELLLGSDDLPSQVDLVIESLTDAGLLVRTGPPRRAVLVTGSMLAAGGLLALVLPSPADAASVPPQVLVLPCNSSYTLTAGPSTSARLIFFTIYAGGGASGSNEPPTAGAASEGNGAGGDGGFISGSITLPASDTETTFDASVGCGGLDAVGGSGPMPGGDAIAHGTNGDGGGGGGASTVIIGGTVVLVAGGGGGGGSASVDAASTGPASGGAGSGVGFGSDGQSSSLSSPAGGHGATDTAGGSAGSVSGGSGSTAGSGPVPSGTGGTGGVPSTAVPTSGVAGGGGGGYYGGGGGAAGTSSTGGGGGGSGYTSGVAVGDSGPAAGATIHITSAGTVSAVGPGHGGVVPATGAPVALGANGQAQFSSTGNFSLTATAHPLVTGTGPALGMAATFSVLDATTVVNTDATIVRGDLGVGPGGTIVGFPPGIARGTTHRGDSVALQAVSDFDAAYANAAARAPLRSFAGDQNGQIFTPGVYYTDSAFSLTGILTLDGQGDSKATFIFQVNGALDTSADSNVSLVNGAKRANVFWQVVGAAGTGESSFFLGTILANGAINLGAGSHLNGRALSRGTITLANTTVGL
ncbi:MAG: hypothetical protein JWM76_3909 [Pseudonocardiales bacterium]|nr:hypothetical protein [Pseudonocardiales bacterium]